MQRNCQSHSDTLFLERYRLSSPFFIPPSKCFEGITSSSGGLNDDFYGGAKESLRIRAKDCVNFSSTLGQKWRAAGRGFRLVINLHSRIVGYTYPIISGSYCILKSLREYRDL